MLLFCIGKRTRDKFLQSTSRQPSAGENRARKHTNHSLTRQAKAGVRQDRVGVPKHVHVPCALASVRLCSRPAQVCSADSPVVSTTPAAKVWSTKKTFE